MKKLFFLICIIAVALCVSVPADAQILKKIGDKVKQKSSQRADEKIDKTIDKGLDEVEGKNKENADEPGESKDEGNKEAKNKTGPAVSQSLKSYSKFDFVPGDKIVYAEDFSQDVIGEFPVKWNTNGTGEVVTIDAVSGKWLQLTEATAYQTPYKNKLPENYTVEFDLLFDYKEDQSVPWITFKLFRKTSSGYEAGPFLLLKPNNGTYSSDNTRDRVSFHSLDEKGSMILEGKDQLIGEVNLSNKKPIPVHVSVWVQKERIRAWVNQLKVYDLPKGVAPGAQPDQIGFDIGNYGGDRSNYQYYLSNIKVAVASPDTRSKLITEGKWSTTGILFDVNSDKIKPASYGTLKEISAVLNENPGVKVRIIGHTDSDGDDAKNLDLSKRRAAAVKTALVKEFSIDEARMETDGMGEAKTVADNKTPEGKAQNRRVEFVKL